MIRFAMMRHGHTPWNRAGQIQGRTDIALDDDARAALTEFTLPDNWAGEDVDVVASPLSRAIETAFIVTGRAPEIADPLIEMDWGEWEGFARRRPEGGPCVRVSRHRRLGMGLSPARWRKSARCLG